MGLQRTQDVVSAVDRGVVVVPMSFSVTGGAATNLKGDLLASVTYTSAGVYTVNLTDSAYDILCAIPGLSANASSGGARVETGTISLTNKTVPVRYINSAGSAADPAAASDRINLVLYLKKTAVTKGGGPL